MFENEDKYPHQSNSSCLPALRRLGLKKSTDVTSEDLLATARMIERLNMTGDKDTALRKARKLVDFLIDPNHHEIILNFDLTQLHDTVCWPCMTSKPANYPEAILFYDDALARPSEVSNCDVQLLGSVMATSLEPVVDSLAAAVGLQCHPRPESVLQHTKNLVSTYTVNERSSFLSMTDAVYSFLSKRISSN